MKIFRVQVENYRNLKSIDVNFGNIVTLIGENNSGKSNFLRALSIPLSSDDTGVSKRLSWYDINREAKEKYYEYLKTNKQAIVDGTITTEDLYRNLPYVRIRLFIQPEENEHYDVKDILCNEEGGNWIGGIVYHFFVNKVEELLVRLRNILSSDENDDNVRMSLLPIDLFTYTLTVPGKEKSISYETQTRFRSVALSADRDNFSSNADRLGSKALSDLLQRGLTSDSIARIEKQYNIFFDIVRDEGKLDNILNWQVYSDVVNARQFFQEISILPNVPQMSSILGSIRLGYEDESMFLQGLGHRNLILMSVILNSYLTRAREISFRLVTVEEPEAHLCNSNTLLMASLFNVFSKKNIYTQIVYSTHNTEFVNKVGIDNVIVFHNGSALNLNQELSDVERKYLIANPNTDIFTLLYSKKVILIEGITEELLCKAYLQTRKDINDIKVLSFHKGFTKIIQIWKKINAGSSNRLGIVRDFDNQPNAQAEHEKMESEQVIVRTTKGYTLETDIAAANHCLLVEKYGEVNGWIGMSAKQIEQDWRKNQKTEFMIKICQDLLAGELDGFVLPPHIQQIIDFMQEVKSEG